jgi:hypothetical protein
MRGPINESSNVSIAEQVAMRPVPVTEKAKTWRVKLWERIAIIKKFDRRRAKA